MQKLKYATVFLLPVYFLLAGCNNSNPAGTDEPQKQTDSRLVGDWECYKTVAAGISQNLPENARMKASFTSAGSYDLASTDEGKWRTSNDSLYITSSINNVELFYAVYKVSGSEIIFDIAGSKQYYKKTGGNVTPVNIKKENLYGKWACYQIVYFDDGEEVIFSEEDDDWDNMEFSFSATQLEQTWGDEKESASWDLQNDVIISHSEDETYTLTIISFDNGLLVLEDDEESEYYLKKE